MAVSGVHHLALAQAKERFAQTEVELAEAKVELDSAIDDGDLRENSPYDIAKAKVSRISREMDELAPVMTMDPVRSNDTVTIIEEGSVVELIVYKITASPVPTRSEEFEQIKSEPPAFRGTLMYGGSLSFHELLGDKILAVDTPVGKFLLGKQAGDYSIPVPAGFANVSVKKVANAKYEDLYCEVGAGVAQ